MQSLVFPVNLGRIGRFFAIDAHRALAHESPGLGLARGRPDGDEEVDEANARLDLLLEGAEEDFDVFLPEAGHVPVEEGVRHIDRVVGFLFPVDVLRHLVGELLLGNPGARVGEVFLLDLGDLLKREEGEDLEVTDGVVVRAIDEVLVELVRGGQFRVEEEGPVLALAELLAVAPGDEVGRHDLGLRVFPVQLPDELEAGCKVPPLVVPADLDAHALVAV